MADVVPSLLIVALVKLRKKLAAPDGSQTSGRLVEGAREQRLHAASAERRPLDQTAHARSWTTQARAVHRNQQRVRETL